MQGYDPDDPVSVDRPAEPVAPLIDRGVDGLRIALAGGYFRNGMSAKRTAIERVAAALRVEREVEFPKPLAPAPQPMSSPRPRARRFTLTACAPARATSTRGA